MLGDVKMKKCNRLFLLSLAIFGFMISACADNEIQPTGNTSTVQYTAKDGFLEYLKDREIDSDLLYFTSDRFDTTNEMQSFAIVGSNNNSELMYTDGKEVSILKKGLILKNAPTVALTSTKPLYLLSCVDISGKAVSYAYTVADGQPVELIGAGEELMSMGNDDFCTTVSQNDRYAVDGYIDGRSQKRYYLYFDGEKFREYGGIAITEPEFAKLNKSETVLNSIRECGYTVNGLIYRANGIVNINCEKTVGNRTEYENLTVKIIKNTCICIPSGNSQEADYVGRSTYGGSYKTAAFPEIATYPEKFIVE